MCAGSAEAGRCYCPAWALSFRSETGNKASEGTVASAAPVCTHLGRSFVWFSLYFLLCFPCHLYPHSVLSPVFYEALGPITWSDEIFRTALKSLVTVCPTSQRAEQLCPSTCDGLARESHVCPALLHRRPRGNLTPKLKEIKLPFPSLARAWSLLRHWEGT